MDSANIEFTDSAESAINTKFTISSIESTSGIDSSKTVAYNINNINIKIVEYFFKISKNN